jgi:DNA-binding MurR/RpiR family transcriptional regulator
LLIAFCFARYARVTIHAIEVARKAGAKTVGITDSVTSPAAGAADLVLVCATQTDSFFNSYVSAVSLIYALAICLANLDESTVLERLRKVDEALPDDWFC